MSADVGAEAAADGGAAWAIGITVGRKFSRIQN
jgi:hypothetical protein